MAGFNLMDVAQDAELICDFKDHINWKHTADTEKETFKVGHN